MRYEGYINVNRNVLGDVQLPVEQTVLQVRDLQKELLVLRLAFGQLKASIAQAAEPVAAVLVPALTGAVREATRLVRTLGQVIAGLLGVQTTQYKIQKTVVSTGKALKRTVAGFDQLNRLQGNSGGGSVSTQQVPVEITPTLSPKVQEIVNAITDLLEPLKHVDLFPLQWGVARLQDAFLALLQAVGPVLSAFWGQILVPFVRWFLETLSPALLGLGTEVLKFLKAEVADAGAGFVQLLADMLPVAEFIGSVAVTAIELLQQIFRNMRLSVETDGSALGTLFRTVGDAAGELLGFLGPVLEGIREEFSAAFAIIGQTVGDIMTFVLNAISGAVTLISGVLSGDWSKAWEGMGKICKNTVNLIIGVLNVMLSSFAAAINGVFKLLNRICVKVPDWVPGLGGKTFGFNFRELTAPKIPYLAKGAVLPANKPFLAMVGDQKHGTNIEAPLATIQEAVALTIEDFAQSNLAGHQATVDVLRQILEAVLGIRIGDAELYRAVERYREKRAVMHGAWG